jgi:hypothetical protein
MLYTGMLYTVAIKFSPDNKPVRYKKTGSFYTAEASTFEKLTDLEALVYGTAD